MYCSVYSLQWSMLHISMVFFHKQNCVYSVQGSVLHISIEQFTVHRCTICHWMENTVMHTISMDSQAYYFGGTLVKIQHTQYLHSSDFPREVPAECWRWLQHSPFVQSRSTRPRVQWRPLTLHRLQVPLLASRLGVGQSSSSGKTILCLLYNRQF